MSITLLTDRRSGPATPTHTTFFAGHNFKSLDKHELSCSLYLIRTLRASTLSTQDVDTCNMEITVQRGRPMWANFPDVGKFSTWQKA